MLDTTTTRFSHVRPGDTQPRGTGLRDLFLYRDLGVEKATASRVLVQVVTANMAPEKGTGWHLHEAALHIVLMLRRFMYGYREMLVAAGGCVHQRPGIVHYLFDDSPDMEYLDLVGPADFRTVGGRRFLRRAAGHAVKVTRLPGPRRPR